MQNKQIFDFRDQESKVTYLKEHHHITDSAIGLVHINLKRGDNEKALRIIEKTIQKLNDLDTEFFPV